MKAVRRRLVIVGLACIGGTPALAQGRAAAITGVVFVDRNANGRQDPGEGGLAGVAVSDQRDVSVTDARGRYALPPFSGTGPGALFVSVPDGYRATPRSWIAIAAGGAPVESHFALVADVTPRSFTFVHASDTHISEQSVARTRMLKALVDSLKPRFVLLSGDLVRDALRVNEAEARRYYELFVAEIAKFSVPVWSVPGNHELFGIERHKSLVSERHPLYGKGMYRSYLGPTYYSFTAGGIHFLGLDSVDYDDLFYYGHVDSTQLAWMQRDLAAVPAGTPVVTFNHIPLAGSANFTEGYDESSVAPSLIRIKGVNQYRHIVSNTAAVLALLTRQHEFSLALGGHYHTWEHIVYDVDGKPRRFFQTAAVVGPSSLAGKPMRSGVTLYRVTNAQVDDGEFIPLDRP